MYPVVSRDFGNSESPYLSTGNKARMRNSISLAQPLDRYLHSRRNLEISFLGTRKLGALYFNPIKVLVCWRDFRHYLLVLNEKGCVSTTYSSQN